MTRMLRTLALTLTLLLVASVVVPPPPAPAADDVKIALVAPLSGRWARQGQLKKMGADLAIEEINSQGGIKALGGAKIVLREADAGDSVEKAVSAAQRVLTREKISAGIGSWLSSFTLGVTEVAERLQVPWLTLSYADSITERGFKYTFQTSPVSSVQAEQALDLVTDLARKNNHPIKKAAIVGDNTAATVFFFKPLREKLLAAKGIELVVDEVWTPPLADATAIVQKLRATQPDIVFYGATNFPDSIQVLQKVKEFSVKSPIQGVGAWLVTPEYVKTLGKEMLDSIQTVVATHPMKGQEEFVKKFTQRTGEPFMTQDPLCTYGHVWLIKEAIEQAKSADPKAIRDALAKIDVTSGPAATAFYPNRIKFDERGRRIGATPLIVQWQGGEPFTVVPTAVATRPVAWHK
jgi:branched-chain amino acid transport system substrate-binding protein